MDLREFKIGQHYKVEWRYAADTRPMLTEFLGWVPNHIEMTNETCRFLYGSNRRQNDMKALSYDRFFFRVVDTGEIICILNGASDALVITEVPNDEDGRSTGGEVGGDTAQRLLQQTASRPD